MKPTQPISFALFFSAVALATLAGCATSTDGGPVARDPSIYCFSALSRDPRLAPLAARIGSPATADSASVAQMASPDIANAAEREVVNFWGAERQRCFDQGRAFRAGYAAPEYALALERYHLGLMEALAKLYGGTWTYGQFITERKRMALAAASSPLAQYPRYYLLQVIGPQAVLQ